MSQVTIDARGGRACVRGGAIAPDAWERMISEGVDRDVWDGGTVRLSGSDLVGGVPALHVTGVAFHTDDIESLAKQQRPTGGRTPATRATVAQAPATINDVEEAVVAKPERQRQAPDLSVLHSGALLLTVKQTEAALARGRTWIYDRIKEGKLEQPEGDSRITAASVRRCAGLPT